MPDRVVGQPRNQGLLVFQLSRELCSCSPNYRTSICLYLDCAVAVFNNYSFTLHLLVGSRLATFPKYLLVSGV